MIVPLVSFAHLYRLSDETGLFEHAKYTRPRREHGYCVDDVARGLLVAAREPRPDPQLATLTRTYLRFVMDAQTPGGLVHNRRGTDQQWHDDATAEDCWGRALWGLGTVVRRIPELAALALERFEFSCPVRSPWSRAMAFAALGAAEVLRVEPDHAGARALLADAVIEIGAPETDPGWQWPELRLRYANAALAEVHIAAGALLGDDRVLGNGLAMLRWLVRAETSGDHLSPTPVAGWSFGEPRPGFDQQPIEVAALADAAATAFDVTADDFWLDVVALATGWFLGANDARVSLVDPLSGGGCDGLSRCGRNENQGAESTLALLSTFQQAHRLPARLSL